MRAVKHVVDKGVWESSVADLLQSNVRAGILPSARLASCATAVALRRVLKAAVHEVKVQLVYRIVAKVVKQIILRDGEWVCNTVLNPSEKKCFY